MEKIHDNQQLSESLEVQVVAKKMVTPSFPTPNHLQSYKLSFFDQLAPNQDMPLLYLYPNHHDHQQTTININEEVLDDIVSQISTHEKLQISLANTLSHFYPIAGRFSNDGLSVVCHDQGVLYVEAKVNCRLAQFQEELHRDSGFLSQFFAQRRSGISESDAIGRVQVTFFECGGFALTGLISHNIADGFIGCTFIDEWAKMTKFGRTELEGLSFNGASIFPPRDLSGVLLRKPVSAAAAHDELMVTKRVIFDKVAVEKLKNEAKANDPSLLYLSKVEVVLAFVWKGLIRAAQARDGRLRASLTSLAVGLRGKKTSPLLEIQRNTFGNLVVGVPLYFRPDKEKMALHHFVHLIRNTLRHAEIAYAKCSSREEIFSMVVNFQGEFWKMRGNEDVDVWIGTSLCRFPLYETDFGWGKPSWVLHDHGKPPFEMFKLLDTKCGTGVEVLLHLKDLEMDIFGSDPEIAAIASTIH